MASFRCSWRFCIPLLLLGYAYPAAAQVVRDNTLPVPSEVAQSGNTIVITGGTEQERNLFHSFSQFSVPEGEIASFQGFSGNVRDIFSRVTGTTESIINGRVQVIRPDGSTAPVNLLLINPNGIVFGENATLNVPGSFLATTADRINFADGTSFSARSPQTASLLTVSVPVGLQFGATPGPIIQRSFAEVSDANGNPIRNVFDEDILGLAVPTGQTLALIGGNIEMAGGGLVAEGGQIELGSVLGQGLVGLQPTANGWIFGYQEAQNFGSITFSDLAFADVNGEQGGRIGIRGDRIRLLDESVILAQTRDQAGRGIFIQASSLEVSNGSSIDASTVGSGRGGDISIVATDFIQLSGAVQTEEGPSPSDIVTLAAADDEAGGVAGSGGNISVFTNRLSILGGARIAVDTTSSGNAGIMTIQATDIELVGGFLSQGRLLPSTLSATTFESTNGNGGTIIVDTQRLSVRDGATIQATTQGLGNAGDVRIRAGDRIEIIGSDPSTGLPSALLTFSGSIPGIEALCQSAGACVSDATGTSGDMSLTTPLLSLQNGALIATGSSSLQGTPAGNLEIIANTVLLENNSSLQANTNSGQGGTMNLQIRDLLFLSQGSQISTSAGSAQRSGNAGNITIAMPNGFIVAPLNQDNDITGNAFSGAGALIKISAQDIFGLAVRRAILNNGTNDIDVSSEVGVQGQVIINNINVDPTAGLSELPAAPTRTTLAQGCQAGGAVASAEFFNTGRGGLPETPYDPLSSSEILADVRLPSQAAHAVSNAVPSTASATGIREGETRIAGPVSISAPNSDGDRQNNPVEARGWRVDAQGNVALVAETPTNASQRLCHLR